MHARRSRLRKAVIGVLSAAALAHEAASAQEASGNGDTSQLTEVVVTGSRIRGTAPVGSTVIGLDRSDIEVSSGVTVDRIIKEVPQVFDLGVSESSRGQSGGAGNIVFGNTINLRGIGPYATLVLVDGHRTVSNSRSVDPSIIPSLGLERIEILADGSSAVYGSDAVAGVVNLIPRRSLNGINTSLRYGAADSFDEYQAGIAGGKVWDSGQVMVAYEHAFRSNLNGDDRDYFTSDQRAFGGTDGRTTQCNPGTIFTTSTGGTSFAIPAAGVTSATAASLVAGTTNRCDVAQGQDLLPQQKYNSLNATFTQRVTDWFEVFADGFYSKREFVRQPSYTASAKLSVPSTNAFYVTPPGVTTAPTFIDYNFAGDLPRDTQTGSAESWEVTPGLRFNLPHDLRAELLYTYGENDDESINTRGLNNAALTSALASNNPLTAFDPYGLHRTTAPTLAGISNQISLAPTLNIFRGMEVRLDGPIVELPGGALRFATGYERQEMEVRLGTARGNPGTPVTFRNFSRNVDSSYLELMIPVFGSENAVTAVRKLEVTAAIRQDKYTLIGKTTNPKFGVNWMPVDAIKFRASYGTSFRAPLISEIYGNSNALFGQNYVNPAGGAPILGFAQSGANEQLQPEEATTWTAGVDLAPGDHTNIALTYFDVKYESQVTNYLSNLALLSLESDLAGTGIILRGTAAGDRVAALYNNGNGLPLARGSFPGGNPQNAVLYVDGRNRNLGTSITRGVDFEGKQRMNAGSVGNFTFSLSGTYFTKYDVALTSTASRTDRLNTIFNPLRLKARASVNWDYGIVGTKLALNYVNSYDNTATSPTQRVAAYTPIDLSVTLRGDDITWLGAFGENFSVGIEVRNVLDEDPPYVNMAQSGNGGGGFDPTASNPIGRLIGVRLTKNW